MTSQQNDIERRHASARMSQIAATSVADQTREILGNIDAYLAEMGTDKSRVLQAQIWLSDMACFAEMNEVWDAWVDPKATPVRACVQAALASPDWKVEIMVTAAR